MNLDKCYQDLMLSNYFLFRYNLGTTEPIELSIDYEELFEILPN